MAKVGGFDPGSGISLLRDGGAEIGRANLPPSVRFIPESQVEPADALVYGKLGDSSLLDAFAGYLAPELRHRELLAPDVFFETLEKAADSLRRESGEGEREGEGPLVEAARALAEILADRDLCEMLRNLIMKA